MVQALNFLGDQIDLLDYFRKILKFCELDWDDKCLTPEKHSRTPIKTVSVAQARQPIYKTSLNNSNNFDKYLGNMYSILKQNID